MLAQNTVLGVRILKTSELVTLTYQLSSLESSTMLTLISENSCSHTQSPLFALIFSETVLQLQPAGSPALSTPHRMPAVQALVALVTGTSDAEATLAITLSIVLGKVMIEPSPQADAKRIFLLSYSHTHSPFFSGRRCPASLGSYPEERQRLQEPSQHP